MADQARPIRNRPALIQRAKDRAAEQIVLKGNLSNLYVNLRAHPAKGWYRLAMLFRVNDKGGRPLRDFSLAFDIQSPHGANVTNKTWELIVDAAATMFAGMVNCHDLCVFENKRLTLDPSPANPTYPWLLGMRGAPLSQQFVRNHLLAHPEDVEVLQAAAPARVITPEAIVLTPDCVQELGLVAKGNQFEFSVGVRTGRYREESSVAKDVPVVPIQPAGPRWLNDPSYGIF